VVYYYIDEKDEKRQRWETFDTHKEALRRKNEVDYQLDTGTFLPPTSQTVSAFLVDFASLYGEEKWALNTYESNTGLIQNYINPHIGHMKLQDITPKFIDQFYKTLQGTAPVSTKTRKASSEYVSPRTIEKIHKLLKCAFHQAVRWELIPRNPFDLALVKKTKYQPRAMWDADTIRKALNECRDSKLYIAMNLAFACSMREGEICGLTWDNVHISDADIGADNAYVLVDKELQRCSVRVIEILEKKDILTIFPTLNPRASTRLVLKHPKTDSSVRRIWLPKTVAYILRSWRKSQEELKAFLGDEYQDHNLVLTQEDGRPCEGRLILKELKKLREDARLPNVCFHSLRHSSTTYKLKLNHGDLKATQGDTGHAEIDMITKVYAHILDEDRKVNAQKFEAAFYSNPDLRDVKAPPSTGGEVDLSALISQLQESPELAKTLAEVIGKIQKPAV
jgi:integrase